MQEETKELVTIDDNDSKSDFSLEKLENVKSQDELKEIVDQFNLTITKKEMSRVMKQDELLDLILKQAGDRIAKNSDEISTKDLLEYMEVFQKNIDKSQGLVDKVKTAPTIQINQHKDVVVNIGDLNRNSTENVIDAVKEIIGSLGDSSMNLDELINQVQTLNIDEGDKHD